MRWLSVRARLALWYAASFAILLTIMATAAYLFLARTTATRLDEYLAETADATADALASALSGSDGADTARVNAVLREFRFREIGVAVFDAGPAGEQRRPPAPKKHPVARGDKPRTPRRSPVTSAVAPSDPRQPAPFQLLGPLSAQRRLHLFGGDDSTGQRFARAVALRAARRGSSIVETVETDDETERVLATPVGAAGRALVVGVSQSLREQVAALDEARTALLFGLPLALLLATAGGYVLARHSLRPVDEMAARAAHIGATTLHERLPAARSDDELGRLTNTFNALLGRLDESFQRQRQFMADVSHELRTPVAIVRGEAELALSRPEREGAEYRGAMRTIADEAARLTQVVNDLFLLARVDADDRPLQPTSLYLEELVSDCVNSMRTLAARNGVEVRFSPEVEVEFTGDEKLLRRMVMNLLDNAIKYTPSGGEVSVSLSTVVANGARAARIYVSDTGPGIPEDARERVFERFYRVRSSDAGGVGDTSGAGLGLPIAAWVARSHGGHLSISETGPGGTTFTAEVLSGETAQGIAGRAPAST